MIKNTLLLFMVLAFAAWSAPVLAVDAPVAAPASPTFGVVDMSRVMKVTEVAKDVFNQLENKRKEYQVSISKEEDILRAAEQKILKEKDGLSKEDFEKKRKDFEERVIEGQKLVQDRKRILDQAFNTSMGNVRNEAAKIVKEIAKEKNYSAVFTQDAVMISEPGLDMTDTVIEKMNKNVKKIVVDWSAFSPKADSADKSGKKN